MQTGSFSRGSELQSAICNLQSKPVVGLIGGMGSGKSLVAELFRRRGAKVISGDQLGHEALGQPEVVAEVLRRWGRDLLEPQGTISRRRLAAIVFENPEQRHALEALVFPWIERRMKEEIAAARECSQCTVILLDAAIMLEAGWNRECDWLVYVQAPRAVRLRRLEEQRGWNAKEVQARENAQMSLADKVSRAAYVINNSGTPEQLAHQIDQLLQQWRIARVTRKERNESREV